jgi:hypothetical protein
LLHRRASSADFTFFDVALLSIVDDCNWTPGDPLIVVPDDSACAIITLGNSAGEVPFAVADAGDLETVSGLSLSSSMLTRIVATLNAIPGVSFPWSASIRRYEI